MNWDLESIYPNIDSVKLQLAFYPKWEKQIPELESKHLSCSHV